MLLCMREYSLFIRKLFLYGVFSVILFGIGLITIFSFIPRQQAGVHEESMPPVPVLTTDVWGIFDVEQGVVIAGENIDTVRPIASVAKLFTGEVVLKSAQKNNKFLITVSDVETEGRAGKLEFGKYVTPYELLYPLLLESSNDAAHAIKRQLGDEYDTTLATLTSSLGLTHTVICDGSGLSPNNVSTIRELAKYYSHLKQSEPHLLDITQVQMFIAHDTGYVNNNPGRTFGSFRGGKQGLTDEAGRTFVGSFVTNDGENEYGVVLLGSNDLKADLVELQSYGESIMHSSAIMSP